MYEYAESSTFEPKEPKGPRNDMQEIAHLGERLEKNAQERRELLERARMMLDVTEKTRHMVQAIIAEHDESNANERNPESKGF